MGNVVHKKMGVMLLTIMTIILLFSCSKHVFQFQPIELVFEIGKNQSETCCYTDDKEMIFSIGTRNGKAEGPLVNTDSIVKYDYNSKKIISEYTIDSDAYITQILPYEDGILYVDYKGTFENVAWEILYFSDKGEKNVVLRGECLSYEYIPQLSLIDGKPIILWQDKDGTKWGIDIIENGKVSSLVTDSIYKLGIPHLMSNGEKYCVLVSKDNSEYGTYIIGDINGIKWTHDLDMKIFSSGITKNYFVCSMGNDKMHPKILKIDLETGKYENIDMLTQLYRITAFSEKTCLAMKEDLTFTMLDIETCKLQEMPLPDDVSEEKVLFFYPVSENKSIIMEMGETDKYYLMH